MRASLLIMLTACGASSAAVAPATTEVRPVARAAREPPAALPAPASVEGRSVRRAQGLAKLGPNLDTIYATWLAHRARGDLA